LQQKVVIQQPRRPGIPSHSINNVKYQIARNPKFPTKKPTRQIQASRPITKPQNQTRPVGVTRFIGTSINNVNDYFKVFLSAMIMPQILPRNGGSGNLDAASRT
jgi:hypothetical protein